MDLKTHVVLAAKELFVRSRWRRHILPRYVYNFDAAQLIFLCECLEKTRSVAGAVLEIGVAGGETTLFLNNYLQVRAIDKPYFALDTFEGFVAADVAVEVSRRGKQPQNYVGISAFRINKQSWYDETMRLNGVTRVRSIQADVNQFDLCSLGAVAFCLLDVDLYRPSKKALTEVYETLGAGGIIIVDDCSTQDARWDGALQAYQEFMRELGKPEHIVHEKLGVVTK